MYEMLASCNDRIIRWENTDCGLIQFQTSHTWAHDSYWAQLFTNEMFFQLVE